MAAEAVERQEQSSSMSRIQEKVARLIDLEGLNASPERRAQLVEEIRAGGQSGFFHIKNVGVSEQVIDRMRKLSTEFFSSTEAEREQKCGRQDMGLRKFGYAYRVSPPENPIKQHRQTLRFHIFPEAKRSDNTWPSHHLRDVVTEYYEGIYRASIFLAGLLSEGLGLPSNYILERMGKQAAMQGLLINSPSLAATPPGDNCNSLPAVNTHTDISVMDFILHNYVRGIQFFVEDKWVLLPILDPHAICVTVGDSLETISNGLFVSAPHRVVRGSQDRLSILSTFESDLDVVLEPGPELTSETFPHRYKSRTMRERTENLKLLSDLTKSHLFQKPEYLDKSRDLECVGDQLFINGRSVDSYEVLCN